MGIAFIRRLERMLQVQAGYRPADSWKAVTDVYEAARQTVGGAELTGWQREICAGVWQAVETFGLPEEVSV